MLKQNQRDHQGGHFVCILLSGHCILIHLLKLLLEHVLHENLVRDKVDENLPIDESTSPAVCHFNMFGAGVLGRAFLTATFGR